MGSRRARSLRPLVALATLLGLAACTAGVPRTGSVVVVSPVTSAPPPVDPEAFQDVIGPLAGQSDSEVAAGFMNAMTGASMSGFHALADKFEFSPYRTLCDVGGATGQLSVIVAQRHKHMRCTTFDLAVVEPFAKEVERARYLPQLRAGASGGRLLGVVGPLLRLH